MRISQGRYTAVFLLAVLLLPACAGVSERPVPMPPVPMPEVTGTLPERVVTLLPAGSTPAPTATLPARVPDVALPLRPGAPEPQPWQDCALAGGWLGCDSSAPPLAARLAFVTPGQAAVVLDLSQPAGWSVPVVEEPLDTRVSWSPDGALLLAAVQRGQPAVYTAQGEPLGLLSMDEYDPMLVWQPGNRLEAQGGRVISSRGRSAYLEQDADFRWTVVVEPAPGAESQRFALEKEPSDRLRGLIGFVPGTDLLLGQAYYASNQAVMQGAQLFTFDTVSGERRDLAAMSPLGWNAVYAWRGEGPAARLAFIDSSGQMALPTLALFDLATGAVTHPLPQGVAAADPAWRPDGGALAFAASLLGETVPAEDASAYRLPGIYLMAADTGTVTALTQPPAGARDGLPTWAGGGSALLFARTFEDGRLEIHAVQPDGSGERLLVSGLRAECPIDDPGCPWGRWLAMTAR